jgi:hypothetical protein
MVVSLDAALSYNWSHVKGYGPMRDASPSGWKLNLAFPEVRGRFWDPAQPEFALFLLIAGVVLALPLLAWARARRELSGPAPDSPSGPVAAIVFALVVCLSTAATAARGRWTRDEYLPRESTAHRIAADALVRFGNCRVCFTSRRRQIDWSSLRPNPAREPRVGVHLRDRQVTVRVEMGSEDGFEGFGRLQVDYGDGTIAAWTGVVGARELSHAYARPGQYRLAVWLQLPGGSWWDRRTIDVADPAAPPG